MALENRTSIDRRSFLARAGLAAGVTSLAAAAASSAQSPQGLDQLGRRLLETEQASMAELRRLFGAAAAEEGLRINLHQMAVASKHDHLFVAAPVLGLEAIAPLELRDGITQGLIYIQSSTSSLRGFYVVRALAIQDLRVGDQPVLVQMLRGGAVVAEARGLARLWSLAVPPTARGLQAQVGLGFDTLSHNGGGLVRANCWVCPNGVTICVEAQRCDLDAFMPCG
jgi:hypothetical protein